MIDRLISTPLNDNYPRFEFMTDNDPYAKFLCIRPMIPIRVSGVYHADTEILTLEKSSVSLRDSLAPTVLGEMMSRILGIPAPMIFPVFWSTKYLTNDNHVVGLSWNLYVSRSGYGLRLFAGSIMSDLPDEPVMELDMYAVGGTTLQELLRGRMPGPVENLFSTLLPSAGDPMSVRDFVDQIFDRKLCPFSLKEIRSFCRENYHHLRSKV